MDWVRRNGVVFVLVCILGCVGICLLLFVGMSVLVCDCS